MIVALEALADTVAPGKLHKTTLTSLDGTVCFTFKKPHDARSFERHLDREIIPSVRIDAFTISVAPVLASNMMA
jgi:hypothetical protein